ncbi:coiled-coil domain-containing protein [Enterococcus rivorum]|uniref:Uncharacterized protein n=1 Tax=Enterococcus rivorum TaxID=762845 RepID=A0A1E5KVI0_9ENTE|nr:hypothetical protein [Enterococcus rivorum]MBP2098325.1 putative nucleic acid-binding Zn-ribbon protein [Enterococcus rivorum]OEH81884.1 hypothetical protein BCR26_03775 [Enterococcus rivorum]
MAGFKYCEVKFFKEQDTTLHSNDSKGIEEQQFERIKREIKLSFFNYDWSEEQFEEKCVGMLESFQKRHSDFEIVDGCLDFSKDSEVSLSFCIIHSQKMIKSRIKGLKQELLFLVQTLSENEKNSDTSNSTIETTENKVTDSLVSVEKSIEKLSEKSDLQNDKMQAEINNILGILKNNGIQIEKIDGKIQISDKVTENLQDKYRKEQRQFFEEGNQKLLVKFDYLMQTVERLESRVINDKKKIAIIEETHRSLTTTLSNIESKLTEYLEESTAKPKASVTIEKGKEVQQLFEEVAVLKRTIDELKVDLNDGKKRFYKEQSNEQTNLSGVTTDSESLLNHQEIKNNMQQEITISNKENPLIKEHEACRELFSNSSENSPKNKKVKVSKEEFLDIVNRITFCEFNWSNISSQFSKELFNLYDLPAYQDYMENLSTFLEGLNPSDYTIPFVSKNVLFVNRNDWEQLKSYESLNQYLEHILSDHGLLIK